MKKQTIKKLSDKVTNSQKREYATHGAKVMCPFCTIPIGDLMVTSNNIEIQGKRSATTADRIPMTNIIFKGQCIVAPGLIPPPCAAVIRLGEWMNFSPNVQIFGHNALLTESTILCMTGGSQIQIMDSGQVPRMIDIELIEIQKEITDAYWMDENSDEKHYLDFPDYPVTLYIKTMFYKAGDTATVKFISNEGRNFDGGQTELIVSGTVDDDGLVVIKDFKIVYEKKR